MMKQSHYKWLKAGIICSVTGAILIFAGYLNDGRSYVAHAISTDWNGVHAVTFLPE